MFRASISIGGRIVTKAFISIGGHVIGEMPGGYRPWHFARDDRIIRPGERREYLFVTTAKVLRQRLANAGHTRESLEREFSQYTDKLHFEKFSTWGYFYSTSENTRARMGSVTFATLDDWLGALGDALEYYRHVGRGHAGPRFEQREMSDPFIDINRLVECITDFDLPQPSDELPMLTRHSEIGFPCTSLESMAIAMLEVVPDDTECAFDVTDIVRQGHIYCFDDPLSRTPSKLSAVLPSQVNRGASRVERKTPCAEVCDFDDVRFWFY